MSKKKLFLKTEYQECKQNCNFNTAVCLTVEAFNSFVLAVSTKFVTVIKSDNQKNANKGSLNFWSI